MYVLIKWDGDRLLTVFGPFETPSDAWLHAHPENDGVTYSIGLRFSVQPIHRP